MSDVDVVRLGPADAACVARLMAVHLHELRGGSPPRPDRYHAETLLADPATTFVGVRLDGLLIGLAIAHELTDSLTGCAFGAVETVFVRPDRRGHGYGRRLVEAVDDHGRRRGWHRFTRIAAVRSREEALMPEPSATTLPFPAGARLRQ